MTKILAITAVAGLATAAAAQPASFIDLGNIGVPGNYTFDTNGSPFDTELGIWDNTGLLLAADDDGGDGLNSLINIDLTAGMYWLGVSEFNSIFVDGWLNTGTAFEGGDDAQVNLNINSVFAGGGLAGAALEQETLFFKVTVVPAPGAAALLGLGSLVALRRRR